MTLGPKASVSPGNVTEMQLLASTPGLISQRYWEEGPAGGLISPQPQCDSVARSSLRITHQLIESWQQSLGVFLFLFYGLGNGDSKENVKLYNLNQDLNSVSKSCTQIWGYSFFPWEKFKSQHFRS